jgi:hypothetical protein
VGGAHEQPGGLETVHRVGDARGVHLEAPRGAGHRHPALAREAEQAQHLVAGEGEPERLEDLLHATEHELFGAHDRGDDRHAVGRVDPAVTAPLPHGFGDRVEWQG